MNPFLKYTLGRMALFLVVFLALVPVRMNLLVKLMVAVLVSFGLAYFLLRRWRDEVTERMMGAAERRRAEQERLRSALAGEEKDDEEDGDEDEGSTSNRS
jgi:hypothetical protein